jgi:8-amino-7-oxononanoate synthase
VTHFGTAKTVLCGANVKDLRLELDRRKATHLYRSRRALGPASGPEVELDGRRCIVFCSNDYLGLAHHPEVIAAWQRGAERWGVGAGAAHLVSGHTTAHQRLEQTLAEFVGRPRALLFSTGYMANLGVLSALAGRSTEVFEDRLNHASLLDAAALAKARLVRYHHADTADLERRLGERHTAERIIVTDGVFSMDGDNAPLRELAGLARRYDAWLMVDDAHGLGVFGDNGGGSLERAGLGLDDVPVLMGTLGKALGTFGAFVAGSDVLVETLIQQARSYIYTTALPPALAEATLASITAARREAWRRERLSQLVAAFRERALQMGLPVLESDSPIQPLLVGDSARAVELSDALLQRGILVTAIRPPTVPEGTARLRITLSAGHSDAHLEQLFGALAELGLGHEATTPDRSS